MLLSHPLFKSLLLILLLFLGNFQTQAENTTNSPDFSVSQIPFPMAKPKLVTVEQVKVQNQYAILDALFAPRTQLIRKQSITIKDMDVTTIISDQEGLIEQMIANSLEEPSTITAQRITNYKTNKVSLSGDVFFEKGDIVYNELGDISKITAILDTGGYMSANISMRVIN